MDDTLLDGHTAMTASWTIVCAEAATAMGGDAERLRDAIRRESIEFWKDESVSGHWRVKLDDARAFVLERALVSEGLDGSNARQLSQQYADLHRQHSVLFDDAIETLELLRDRGMKLGLLTNGAHDPQWEKIRRFDLARHFDVIVVEGEFGRGKPEPDVFHHALATVGAAAHEAWHIGDNLYADVGGAKSVGISAAWIHRDRLSRPESGHVEPDASVAHLHEFVPLLG
jgi:putative hydrolase of the HAD superfamily